MTHDSSIQEGHETSAGTPRIVITRNGPYLLDGSIPVVDPLGVPVAATAPVRLCRCGQSQTKPFCDNSHVERSFTDDKNPRRVTDKLDVHEGQQAYVFDNRGTFHLGKEPSGARLDDLVNAVRKCPSGALGIGIGPAREANLSDTHRMPQIEVSKDGP